MTEYMSEAINIDIFYNSQEFNSDKFGSDAIKKRAAVKLLYSPIDKPVWTRGFL